MNITNVIAFVADTLPHRFIDDLPAIRESLNNCIDGAVRSGQMTEHQANNWNQDRAVFQVQHLMRGKRLEES